MAYDCCFQIILIYCIFGRKTQEFKVIRGFGILLKGWSLSCSVYLFTEQFRLLTPPTTGIVVGVYLSL